MSLPSADRTGAQFAGDRGQADPVILAALADYVARPGVTAEVALMRLLPESRWLIPVVPAPPGALAEQRHDHPHEHPPERRPLEEPDRRAGELVTTVLASPDGTRALPLFGSLATLACWDQAARPVPARMGDAALAAAQEKCEVLLLDPGSPHAVALRPTMLWALAEERPWLPSHLDPIVAEVVAAALEEARSEGAVAAFQLEAGEPEGAGVLRVVLQLRPGLAPGAIEGLVAQVGGCLAGNATARVRVDALRVVLRPALLTP